MIDASVGEIKKDLDTVRKENDLLKKSASGLKSDLEAIQAENAQHKDQIAALKQENEVLSEMVLDTRTSDKYPEKLIEKPKLPKDATFTFDKKKFELLVPQMHIPDIGYRTAEEILVDPVAKEKLVAINSGAIKRLA